MSTQRANDVPTNAVHLTKLQRELLDELTDYPYDGVPLNGGRLSMREKSMVATARSLEKRGMINIMVDEDDNYYAYWDAEFRADWMRVVEQAEQEQEQPEA